jgi:hypothetical protein
MSDRDWPPFPFVVGCGRSGTTLLRAMVDGHPEMAVPPESHFIVTLADEPFDPRSFLARLSSSERFALWGLDHRALQTALRRSGSSGYADAVRTVFECYAAGQGKPRWADKTPGYVLHVARLVELFPEAVIVHMIRDGRDVAASFLELGWASTIEEAALHWRLRVGRGRRAGVALPGGRYHEIRYEDLVVDPEPPLRTFCGAASLPFDAAMVDHADRAAEVVGTTSHPSYHGRLAEPLRPDLRDWRRDLVEEDVERFELVAGDLLTELGYERSLCRPSARLRADVARRRARWYAHRAMRKAGLGGRQIADAGRARSREQADTNTAHKGVL